MCFLMVKLMVSISSTSEEVQSNREVFVLLKWLNVSISSTSEEVQSGYNGRPQPEQIVEGFH